MPSSGQPGGDSQPQCTPSHSGLTRKTVQVLPASNRGGSRYLAKPNANEHGLLGGHDSEACTLPIGRGDAQRSAWNCWLHVNQAHQSSDEDSDFVQSEEAAGEARERWTEGSVRHCRRPIHSTVTTAGSPWAHVGAATENAHGMRHPAAHGQLDSVEFEGWGRQARLGRRCHEPI
jgi:hypothetical protein